MRRLFPVAVVLLMLTSCTQTSGGAFSQSSSSPSPSGPVTQPQLDTQALTALRNRAAGALLTHLHGGSLDLSWGAGSAVPAAGPYTEAAPEADAAGLQALKSLAQSPATGMGAVTLLQDSAASATTDAFKQLEGPRGGAYLLLADAAHPAGSAAPSPVDSSPVACPTPAAGRANPGCLRRQVSDGLLAAWYAADTRVFFQVGEPSTVYRPVDAIAVGSALVVAGFQLHQENKIEAGSQILQQEMKSDVDSHFGLLYGLITATSQGGRSVTDYRAHLADQAGAAEALLEAFDFSREQQYMADARQLLQPLMDEVVAMRAVSGGYIEGFDLQSAGPPDNTPADVLASVLVLQAAHHYDHDDGGHFTHLEETAAATLSAALEADRKQGGAPAQGLPARVSGPVAASRSGLTTALAVSVVGDVLRDIQLATPTPEPGSPAASPHP